MVRIFLSMLQHIAFIAKRVLLRATKNRMFMESQSKLMDCNISNLLKCHMCQVLIKFNKMCFEDSWIHDGNKIYFFIVYICLIASIIIT